MDKKQNKFTTSDLGLISALTACGFELVDMDKVNKRKITFSFKQIPELLEASQQYWADKLSISALSYFNAIKTVKSRIYETDGDNN